MSNGPFYFAWVDSDQTTFDEGTMLVEDEDIFDFEIKHDEGQCATLHMTIKNPRIGLLNAGRKLWAWLSYRKSNGHVQSLFFGVLVSVPTDMLAELVELKFNARPHEYIRLKQTVAETLKVRPYYDPVFLDDASRDNPDAILEGWSKLYHIDRITHTISASDILEGEDGTVTFTQSQGFYDSVRMGLGECPLDVVQVQANVQWTQRSIGLLPQPIRVNVNSYTGGSFRSGWPKPGGDLGGGWKCEASYVTDVLGTEVAKSISNSSSFQNHDPESGDCSTESASTSSTYCNVPGISVDSHTESETGICDPDAINADGSQGTNIPAKVNGNGTIALLWALNCVMYLKYEAKREFTEEVTINVRANVQATVTSPTVDQNTEIIKISGANVGQPLINVNAWSTIAGTHVDLAAFILPNDRTTVAGNSHQVCVQAGTAGNVEPIFSDLPGDVTIDGTVHWACIGESFPTFQNSWADSSPIALGEIVLYEPKIFSKASGQFETTRQSCYLIALGEGTTQNTWNDFTYVPIATANNETLPLPINSSYIPGPGQTSPYSAPIFAQGIQVVDGTVTWMSLGATPQFMNIPIGGTTENVNARSYFSKDRGHWSIEHLICKARARLRLRSRCVKLDWDAPFEDCLDLSLRKNATLLDGRIPGGAASGKITSYSLRAEKDGKLLGHIEIGVSVGFGNSVPAVTGVPEYTPASGYMQAGYQRYDGGMYSIAEEEISYSAPVFRPFDDGLAFPLQVFPGVVKMTVPNQVAAINAALAALGASFLQAQRLPYFTSSAGVGSSLLGGKSMGEYLRAQNPVEYALSAAPVACEIIIKPVQNGPFNGSITVDCSTLELPQGINLSAGSS